jgi:hypothetical protein
MMSRRQRIQQLSFEWIVLLPAILTIGNRGPIQTTATHQLYQKRIPSSRRFLRSEENARIPNILEKRTAPNDFRGPHLVEGHPFRTEGTDAESYEICRDTLKRVAVDGKVCYSQYCEFLGLISNGEISECKHLDSSWVLLFYTTACRNDQDCDHDDAYISLKEDGVNLWGLHVLCEEAMSHTFTRSVVSFEFSIQYNSSLLDKKEIASCVSDATENLLFSSFGCLDEQRRHLERTLIGPEIHQSQNPFHAASRQEKTGKIRLVEKAALRQDAFNPPPEWTQENCPYSITTEVIVLDLGTYG